MKNLKFFFRRKKTTQSLEDEKSQPRLFFGQTTGLAKVTLYPQMGGETDQADGLRKDGSDAMENKAHLDAQVNLNFLVFI